MDDLGALLRRFYPQAELEAPTAVTRCPPISIRGVLSNTRQLEASIGVRRGTRAHIRFRLLSDIWFPWVYGIGLDLSSDLHKRFDNRELAQYHTPRLNRFLAAVREATQAIGGQWYLDTDRDSLRADRFLVDDDGTPRDPLAGLQARKVEWLRQRSEQS